MEATSPHSCRADPSRLTLPVTDALTGPAWRRRRKGQSTVEFSLILWPFLLLLLATCDYAQIYFYEGSMRHAMQVAGRFATTGGAKPFMDGYAPAEDADGDPIFLTSAYEPAEIMSRNESVRAVFRDVCLIDLDDEDILVTSWPGPDEDNPATEENPNDGPGTAEDFVKLQVSWPLSLVTPVAALLEEDGEYVVTVEGIFRNEPGQNFDKFTDMYDTEPSSLNP